MDVLDDIKKFQNGIMPESSTNFKLIDYLIIAESWSKVANILMSKWRDNQIFWNHLRVVEKIPVNWESKISMLIEIIKQRLISASSILSNFGQLKNLEILEILDDENNLIEENIELNENTLEKLKSAVKDLDTEKV